jgi:hypothetical protein
MRGRCAACAYDLTHADQVDLRRSGTWQYRGTARRPQIAGSPVRRAQVSVPESACDGEVPPTAVARATYPPGQLGPTSTMRCGCRPMAYRPGAGHDCDRVDTSLHVTYAPSASVTNGRRLMNGAPGNDPPALKTTRRRSLPPLVAYWREARTGLPTVSFPGRMREEVARGEYERVLGEC